MTNQKKLRWGILGAARINQQLMPAIVEAGNSELVAIASRRPGAAAETLARYAPEQQSVKIYDGPDALLDDPDIDAVYLPLANREHAEWTLRAIKRGKHVLCEKPMALNVADIDTIEASALQHKVSVMEGFMYRFHPQHARVRAIIDSGLIGEVRCVRSCFAFMMQPAREYRLADDIAHGGGAMWDIGCYAIHAARLPFYNATPLAVTALAKYTETGADSSSCGLIDYGDGKYAQFEFSFEHARRAEYEVIGTLGGLICHSVWAKQMDTPVISWWTESGQQEIEHLPPANHFRLEIEHFSDCVLNGKAPALSLADARTNCKIITAALESAAQGRRVALV
ncbi:MAG: gfo/Idh/MocA family oxidoreductase [Gammaproteobacteria bacterium HGW-Gammaproteobacteria-3]|nr:MAG: gfo/Idh/MocA family oxidoreductase [Gammaproteobacteria bacterium HGW-Gammaproteobacteria-3]